MPFAATWMDLEIIILSEVRQQKTNTICCHLYVEYKKDTNKFICRKGTDSQTLKTNLCLPKGTSGGEEWTGGLGLAYAHCGIWNDWSVGTCCREQRPLYPIFFDNLYRKRMWKGVCTCITESLCCTGEIVTHWKSSILQ